jgi:hypothetical protein
MGPVTAPPTFQAGHEGSIPFARSLRPIQPETQAQVWYRLKITLDQRREIKKIAKSKPAEHDLPFSAWSLSMLAEFPAAEVPYL